MLLSAITAPQLMSQQGATLPSPSSLPSPGSLPSPVAGQMVGHLSTPALPSLSAPALPAAPAPAAQGAQGAQGGEGAAIDQLQQLLALQQAQMRETAAVLEHAKKVKAERFALEQLRLRAFGLPTVRMDQIPQQPLSSPGPQAAMNPLEMLNQLLSRQRSGSPTESVATETSSNPSDASTALLPSRTASLEHSPGPNSSAASAKPLKRSRSEEDLDTEGAKKKRIYVKSACLQCRKSHQACDNGMPCKNCVRNGHHCERSSETFFVPPSVDLCMAGIAPFIPSGAAGSSADSEGRRYVKAACSCCRKAHLACDNFRPCRSCIRLGQVCEQVRSQRRPRRQPTPLEQAASPFKLPLGVPAGVVPQLMAV